MDKFADEINILTKVDHPNIIKLYEVYEDNRYVFLIMEECTGGELFDRILDRIESKKLYSEKEACSIFKQMMSAVSYCHSEKICHRDLKPENLLFLTKDETSPIKVIDFGLSKNVTTGGKNEVKHNMKTKVGTAYYVSPEVLKGQYDESCDIWSSGVILYILLTGDPPFNGPNDNDIYKKIAAKKFTFPSPAWDNISSDVKDLISNMLADPSKRYTAQQVLTHTWVENNAPNSSDVLLQLNTDNLKRYQKTNRLQKAVLTFIASRLKEEDIQHLKEIFLTLDENKDGSLCLEEIKKGISLLKENNLNIEEIFKSIDTDGSGVINYTGKFFLILLEFLAATMDTKVYLKEERLYEAFRLFDKDGSGKISAGEIRKVLQTEGNNDDIDDIIKQIDINGDGEVNL